MTITTILFDLDGTLLPMDQEAFTKGYFKLLAAKLAPHGYDPQQLIDVIWAGTAAMVKNKGEQPNETVFWQKFAETYGDKAVTDKPLFDAFYQQDFQNAKQFCQYNPQVPKTIAALKAKGFRLALATNPIFPAVATESRIRWAGLEPELFERYTTYENTSFCKPNPEYYNDILQTLQVKPEECLMVGNDVTEDMVAQTVGMNVFLLTDCLINKECRDIEQYPHGDFEQLMHFIIDNP